MKVKSPRKPTLSARKGMPITGSSIGAAFAWAGMSPICTTVAACLYPGIHHINQPGLAGRGRGPSHRGIRPCACARSWSQNLATRGPDSRRLIRRAYSRCRRGHYSAQAHTGPEIQRILWTNKRYWFIDGWGYLWLWPPPATGSVFKTMGSKPHFMDESPRALALATSRLAGPLSVTRSRKPSDRGV